MTVETTTSRVSYTGAGSTGPFTIPFYFIANGDIVAIKRTIADGTEVTLTLTTDYTLTGAGDEGGGTLTLVSSLSSSYQLIIYRDPEILQESRFPRNDKFPAATNERVLDLLTMIAQRQSDVLGRSIRLTDGDTTGATMLLPVKTARASMFLAFDADGEVAVTPGSDGLTGALGVALAASSGSSLVGFLQSGSGASARTVEEKLQEVAVSVTDFGATGDGTTDDAAAFEAAIAALPAYGGTVVCPQPTSSYYLATAVDITKRCKIVGEGKLACPIICGASNNAFTALFAGGYVEFENLFIQGAASTGTTGSAIDARGTATGTRINFVRIINCYIKDFTAPVYTKFADHIFLQDVFYFQGVSGITTSPVYQHYFGTGITWYNVKATGSGATLPAMVAKIGSDIDTFIATDCNLYRCGGMTFNNAESGTTFAPRYIRLNNVIVESGKSATEADDSCFHFAAGRDIILNNCTGLSGYHGIMINGPSLVHVNGGDFYFNQRRGVYYNSGTDIHFRNVSIYDNSQATDNTHDAVLISASRSKFSFKGCVIKSQAVSGSGNKSRFGFNIGASCADFEIQNNTIGNMGTNAWNLGATQTNYSYSGNRVDGNPTQGSFTCDADTSTTVTNKNVHAYAVINLQATNTSAAGLTDVYVATKTANTSFAVTHSTGAGTETFDYAINS